MIRTSMNPIGKDERNLSPSFSSYQCSGIYSVVFMISSRNRRKEAAKAASPFLSNNFPGCPEKTESRIPQKIPENNPEQRKQNGKPWLGERDGS